MPAKNGMTVTDLAESAATADMMFESAERGVPVERIFRERGIEPQNYRDEYDLRRAVIDATDRAFIGGEREGVTADLSGDSGRTSRITDAGDDPDAYHVDTGESGENARTVDSLAESAATADLMAKSAETGESVADLIRERYDIEPDDYEDEYQLRRDITEAEAESGYKGR